MEINKTSWSITTINEFKNKITKVYLYHHPSVWTTAQKQMLIDTILRGYDIPKLYLRKFDDTPIHYEVVDGLQRLLAIWSFMAGEYALPKDIDLISNVDVSGMIFDELPLKVRTIFEAYSLDVVVISDAEGDEVREMLLRLKNGATLESQKKRNAMAGQMREFIKGLTQHPIFVKSVPFRNHKYAHDLVAAQLTLIESADGLTNIRDQDLDKMYEEYKTFESTGEKARKIVKVLDYMHSIFPEKTPNLNRYNVVTLYMLLSEMIEKFDLTDREEQIHDWFLDFEQYRTANIRLPDDQINTEVITYAETIRNNTDTVYSLEWRHNYLRKRLLEALPPLEQRVN